MARYILSVMAVLGAVVGAVMFLASLQHGPARPPLPRAVVQAEPEVVHYIGAASPVRIPPPITPGDLSAAAMTTKAALMAKEPPPPPQKKP